MKRALSTGGLALTLTAATIPATTAAITSAEIVTSALSSTSCIQWRVSGVCYWLFCTMFGCSVRTSVKVTHNIPEVVVSTYTDAGGNPWTEMSALSGASGGIENAITGGLSGMSAGGGNAADQKAGGQRHSAVKFKYAEAFGHPATSLIGGAISGYSCDTAATPFIPYFLSTLDALAWRTGVPESLYPEALIPGRREVGNQVAGNMWGNVYPRTGFIQQTDDDKASAVIAQRVADIITRSGEPHVYQALVGQKRPGYWPPPPVLENDASTHTWQRLSPRLTQSCAIFPDGSYPTAADGNESYALWQPYSCCQRRGQTFLGSS
jgi:integrating conjugative element protein (TIGR03756 family)